MARVLISDSLADDGMAVFAAATGLQVDRKPGIDPGELVRVIGEYDALVLRSGTSGTGSRGLREERKRKEKVFGA